MAEDYLDGFDPDEFDDEPDLDPQIDQWLADVRPERYPTRSAKEWMDPVVDKVQGILSERAHDEAIRQSAQRRVRFREGQANRKANSFIRRIALDGQLPIGWGEGETWKALQGGHLRMPLTIGDEKVRVGAADTTDLYDGVLLSQKRSDDLLAANEQLILGLSLLITWMQEQRVKRVEDLRPE